MAFVIKRGERWYVRFRDARGKWQQKVTEAATKTEAKRMAAELERSSERQRMGLEPLSPVNGGGTLSDLLEWWTSAYLSRAPSYKRSVGTIRKHLIGSDLGGYPLTAVTSGAIETFLQSKASESSPQTINHLRGYIGRAFGAAKRAGKWPGANPIAEVPKRKVPRRVPDYLRAEEVPAVLAALAPKWRPLFATALYTGLRRGELLGLRKTDVDLPNRLLTVGRSFDRDTTKGGHADVIPIARELVPYLEVAIDASPSELLFPAEDGSMMPDTVQLQMVLRRALHRAGIVLFYIHKCRRKGCGHSERAADAELRRCPKCRMKLWPAGQVRPIRFHHLRHTTASLLMMAGANPAAVQRILRHSDPRITTEVYGHLAPGYLRNEIDRLSFGPPPPGTEPDPPLGAPAGSNVPPVCQDPLEALVGSTWPGEEPAGGGGLAVVGVAGFEPTTSCSQSRRLLRTVRRPPSVRVGAYPRRAPVRRCPREPWWSLPYDSALGRGGSRGEWTSRRRGLDRTAGCRRKWRWSANPGRCADGGDRAAGNVCSPVASTDLDPRRSRKPPSYPPAIRIRGNQPP
jgi:integrase